MGKNKNKVGKVPPAPEVKAEEKVVEPEVINDQKKVNVIDANGLAEEFKNVRPGLDANHQADVLSGLDRHFMQPNAAQKLGISQETVDNVNRFTAHGWVALAATEAMFGTSEFAKRVKTVALPTIMAAAEEMGMPIDQKLLPAPDADGTIQIPANAIKPNKEVKAQLKKEHEVLEEKPNVDPTKIENEEDLKKAITFIMADAKNGWEKIKNAIAFYRSYLGVTASKKENKEKLLNQLREKTNLELLDEIKNIIHDCPVVLSGMGRAMGTFTGSTKSPITAFCMLRNSATNRKTGETELSDREVADYTRAIVTWVNDLTIENYNKRIAEHKKNLEVLKKDAKKNAEGIKDVEAKIESCKNSIKHCNDILTYVVSPSSEIANTLLDDYADAKSDNNKAARSIFKSIFEAYYADVDLDKNDLATVKHNVQQRAGIILNLFRDPTTPNPEYNEANLTELVRIEPEKEEEPKKE